MLIEHRGERPSVDPSAYVAPTAVLCGDVRVGPQSRILFGAVVSGEDGHAAIGARCVVMENALVRGRASHRGTTTRSGASRRRSTSRAPSTACRGTRRRASGWSKAEWYGAHRDDRLVE